MTEKHFTWQTPDEQSYPKIYQDMLSSLHVLIGGTTGSGKSTAINAMLYTALQRAPGDDPGCVRLVLIDPKYIELNRYKRLPHTIAHAATEGEWVQAMDAAMEIMDRRYMEMRAQELDLFNGGDMYIIIDEWLPIAAQKQCALRLRRLVSWGRPAKVHVVLATRTPYATVVPPEVLANLTSSLGLRTQRVKESRAIIGMEGCEKLPPYGRGYWHSPDGIEIVDLPMCPQERIRARIKFWEDQAEKQGYYDAPPVD